MNRRQVGLKAEDGQVGAAVAIFERAALTPPSPQAKNAEAFCFFGRGRAEDEERPRGHSHAGALVQGSVAEDGQIWLAIFEGQPSRATLGC